MNKQEKIRAIIFKILKHPWQAKDKEFAVSDQVSIWTEEIDGVYKEYLTTLNPDFELKSMIVEDDKTLVAMAWVILGVTAAIAAVLSYMIFMGGN